MSELWSKNRLETSRSRFVIPIKSGRTRIKFGLLGEPLLRNKSDERYESKDKSVESSAI